MQNNHSDDIFEEMILDGIIEPSAMDTETGEMLYSFTDKARELMPEMWSRAQQIFNDTIMFLWEQGFLNINMSDADPVVSVAPKALDESAVAELSREYQQALRIILEALRIQ